MARLTTTRLILGFLVALLVGGGIGALHVTGRLPEVLGEIEGKTLDWRFRLRGPLPAPPEVAIIAIDDESLAELGRWPLPRATLAEALDRLTDAGVRTVALDLLLLEREPPSDGNTLSPGDQALRAALERHGNAVLAAALLFEGGTSPDRALKQELASFAFRVVERPPSGALTLPGARSLLLPIKPLREVAGLGHVNLLLQQGQPRLLHPGIALDGLILPAFAVEAARRQLRLEPDEVELRLGGELVLGDRRRALDDALALPLDFYGPAGTVRTFSLRELLAGRVPPGALAGRVVLVGATALGVGDTFSTPFAQSLPGVEVLATAIANLVRDDGLSRPVGMVWWEAVAAVLLSLAACAGLRLPNPRVAALATLTILLLWLIVVQGAFATTGLWLNATVPASAVILTGLLLAAGRAAHERGLRHEAERQRGNLARYVSPVMAHQLATEERPSFDEREQQASILFFDLSGFTRLAEGRPPSETARFLKDFHQRLETVVLRHAGVVEQFLGDGAMIIFGLPEPRVDDAARALACARDLVVELGAWRPELKPRAGLHHGHVAMARLGGHSQAQLAAAGDTVNVANRLEALASQAGAALAVSEDLVDAVRACGRTDLLAGLEPEGAQDVRGRSAPISIWLAARDALS